MFYEKGWMDVKNRMGYPSVKILDNIVWCTKIKIWMCFRMALKMTSTTHLEDIEVSENWWKARVSRTTMEIWACLRGTPPRGSISHGCIWMPIWTRQWVSWMWVTRKKLHAKFGMGDEDTRKLIYPDIALVPPQTILHWLPLRDMN